MKQLLLSTFLAFIITSHLYNQSSYRLNLSGGIANLFEASVANEIDGNYLGIGLEKRYKKFSFYLDFEKVSCFSSHILGISTITLPNGDKVISNYKGRIDIEQRDFLFKDEFVDKSILDAGRINFVGSRQVFRSQSLILSAGYRLFTRDKWLLKLKLGTAFSINNSVAPNISYTSDINKSDTSFIVTIPTYTKYLYASGYMSLPLTYEINHNLDVSLIATLYRAREIYLPMYGLSLSAKLF